ncbi:hypothetical protein ACJ4Z1_06135 [Bifidobacterium sp. YIT 13610]
MNTCKAAIRILKARKLYVIIYLVLIGTMMFSPQLADHARLLSCRSVDV